MQVIVERFGLFARFGFMHLVATNLALWVRTIIWESANEWIHHVHRQKGGDLLSLSGDVDATRISGDGPVALGLKAGTFSNNYASDRSFTNVDDYKFVDDFSVPDSQRQLQGERYCRV